MAKKKQIKKFYAVKVGRKTGIFSKWEDCRKQIIAYPGAIYRGFPTKEEAEKFMKQELSPEFQKGMELPAVYAFVDGSFNPKTNVYGYGGFLVVKNLDTVNDKEIITKYPIQGCGNEEDMIGMRNVSGEILGSTAAIKKAIELGLDEITIFYDYLGIEMWATGRWKRNKSGTKAYHKFIKHVQDSIDIHFVKVKGHTGIEGNEEADKMAKKAVGIETIESETDDFFSRVMNPPVLEDS